MMRIDVCIPTKDKKTIDLSRMNLDILPVNKIILSDVKGLANARNDLMNKVTTNWFVFVDDDIQLNQEWWDHIKVHMDNPKIGAVNGFGLSDSKILKMIRFGLLAVRGDKSQRGFTSNTLIRKSAIKGIKLERIGRLEDAELQDKIRANGYDWVFVKDARCLHLKKPSMVMKEAWGDFKVIVKEQGLIKAVMKI